jgi:hypothetical protein
MLALHQPRRIGDCLVLRPLDGGGDVTCYRCAYQGWFRSWRRALRAARNHDADHQAYDRASRR